MVTITGVIGELFTGSLETVAGDNTFGEPRDTIWGVLTHRDGNGIFIKGKDDQKKTISLNLTIFGLES